MTNNELRAEFLNIVFEKVQTSPPSMFGCKLAPLKFHWEEKGVRLYVTVQTEYAQKGASILIDDSWLKKELTHLKMADIVKNRLSQLYSQLY